MGAVVAYWSLLSVHWTQEEAVWVQFLAEVLMLCFYNLCLFCPELLSCLLSEIGFCCDEQVDDELEIKAYYAGHVLGAAMFHMRVGTESLVYTVSINTLPG